MSDKGKAGLNHTLKLVVKTFLEQRHYRQLHRILSDKWAGCHSLSAAVKLMEAHGMKVSPEEEKRLQAMSEDRMIEALVARMPQQSRESFEHFFLQLSFIASTTARLRTAIEEGHPELVEEALESAENVGVLGYLIKGAVCQAGTEVRETEQKQQKWLTDTDDKLGPLLQSQAMALVTARALAAAEKQLNGHYGNAKDKSKSFLMNMAEGKSKALTSGCFGGWADHTRRMRHENEIRKEYEDQINDAVGKLAIAQKGRMDTIRRVLNKNFEETKLTLMSAVFGALRDEADAARNRASTDRGIQDIQQTMRACKKKGIGHASKLLASLTRNNDNALKAFVWDAFLLAREVTKQDKQEDTKMQATERNLKSLKQKTTQGVKNTMRGLTAEVAGNLVDSVFKGWSQIRGQIKRFQEGEVRHTEKLKVCRDFHIRNKVNAKSHHERHATVIELETLLVIVSVWKRETRIEKVRRWGKDKNMKRKQELIGVKGLFKSFADELETSLKEGTPRVISPASKSGGAVKA